MFELLSKETLNYSFIVCEVVVNALPFQVEGLWCRFRNECANLMHYQFLWFSKNFLPLMVEVSFYVLLVDSFIQCAHGSYYASATRF